MGLDDLLDVFDQDGRRGGRGGRRGKDPERRGLEDDDDSEHGLHRRREAQDDSDRGDRLLGSHGSALQRLRQNKALFVAALVVLGILLVGAIVFAVFLVRYIDEHGFKSVVDTVKGWFGRIWAGSGK
jgi:hypothetical protein